MNLQKECHELQRFLAQTDLLFEPRRGGSNPMELLLVKRIDLVEKKWTPC